MSFVGNWSYRSLVNNPDLDIPFDQLQFGKGTLSLREPNPGIIGGTIGGPNWSLELEGEAFPNDPTTLRFTGRGEIGDEPWEYSYLGYMVPNWPNGIDQVDAIVGSIVRDITHSNGNSPAGVVASWYAVRQ